MPDMMSSDSADRVPTVPDSARQSPTEPDRADRADSQGSRVDELLMSGEILSSCRADLRKMRS
eukprot:6245884-Prymnesium_polylepis.1